MLKPDSQKPTILSEKSHGDSKFKFDFKHRDAPTNWTLVLINFKFQKDYIYNIKVKIKCKEVFYSKSQKRKTSIFYRNSSINEHHANLKMKIYFFPNKLLDLIFLK